MKTKRWLGCCWQLKLVSVLILLGLSNFDCKGFAQSTPSNIQPDNSLGAESSRVVQNFQGLPVEVIAGGASRGINLFHSFREFNVSEGRGAYFFSPNAGIQNILARVTGGNRSEILGILGTFQITNGNLNGSNANLFLINPNGILFGKNASLDTQGSFIGTTASSVNFTDEKFSTIARQNTSLLSIGVPLGLQFGASSGKIIVQGDGIGSRSSANVIDTNAGLRVSSNQTLALVGGDINLEGATLKTAGGRIELGSVSDEGLVSLIPTGKGFLLSYGGVENFGNIQLTQKSAVDASGVGAGNVQVTGKRITLSGGSQIESSTLGANNGGGLLVNATESIELYDNLSTLATQVYPGAAGNGGNLRIFTKDFLARNGAQVSVSTYGTGNGGNLTVNASSSIQVIGKSTDNRIRSSLSASAYQGLTGKAGDLIITTKDLLVRDGAQINTSTFGAGNGGNLTLNATGRVELIGASTGLLTSTQPGSTGDAGELIINAQDLLVHDGAQVFAGTSGKGNGRNLTINAFNSVQVSGQSANGQSLTGLSVSSASGSTGNAGNLSITTKDLFVRDGTQISAGTFGVGNGGNLTVNAADRVELVGQSANGQSSSGLYISNKSPTGTMGNLILTTKDLFIRDGASINADTFGMSKGGNITVNASNIEIVGNPSNRQSFSNVSASTQVGSTGNAGDLTINTQNLLARDGGLLFTATFGQGNGGNLTVNASGNIELIGGGVNASTQIGSTGNAGNINFVAQTINLSNQAYITSSTVGQGQGGKITLKAEDAILLSSGSTITSNSNASTFGGVNNQSSGDIEIRASKLSVDGAKTFINSTNLDEGKAGNIQIITSDLISLNDLASILSANFGNGDGGNIQLQTRLFNLFNGSYITTSTQGRGNGGNLLVNASDSVNLSGINTLVNPGTGRTVVTGSILSTSAFGTGKSGELTINTGQLNIRDAGNITTTAASQVSRAGELNINAKDSVEVVGSLTNGLTSFISAGTVGSGDAGNMTINTPRLSIRDGAGVSATSAGIGNAGIMTINANNVRLSNKGTITANTRSPNKNSNREQATINLNTRNLTLRRDSSITTNATGANVVGGNINIGADFVIALENSRISANSDNSRGGQVRINAQGVFVGTKLSDVSKYITATSGVGLFGTVEVISPDNSTIQNNLNEVPQNIIDANALIANSCIASGTQKQEGSFIITGTGALPNRPGENAASIYTTGTVRNVSPIWKKGTPIIEPQGVYKLPNGQIIMSRECN